MSNKLIGLAKPDITRKEINAVIRVMRSGNLAQGPEVLAFENEFSETLVTNLHSVAVNSGTSALHLLLLANNIGSGHEVIVPSFSFAATANSVELTGASAVFADIDPSTFCIDPNHVESLISNKTRAIMAVHLYGMPANMPNLVEIAKRHGLLLIEDAAQAHGAMIGDILVGSFADGAAFSFYPTKNMTSGEGGMAVTRDQDAERRIRMLRNQGMEKRYQNELIGFNYRMTDLHAAIGRVQLKKIHKYNSQRVKNAAFFNANLNGVELPIPPIGYKHVYHQYTIRVLGHNRDRFVAELEKLGIGTGVYYPTPIHLLPAYKRSERLKETESACQEVISIPVHPRLTPKELHHISTAVNKVARAGA
jgi:perosamine synthetase